MLIGYLPNMKEEMALYPEAIKTGLDFLAKQDLSALTIGQHEIKGTEIYAIVSEYKTQPKDERKPEAHGKYVDIQYICSGKEAIGVAPLKLGPEIEEDCLCERDVVFFRGVESETMVTLYPGMFGVFFPWDVHRPNCNADDQPAQVRKIVVKIAISVIGL
ncbi:MAG: hypothetical protein H6Q75_1170 [Firmicutes bacterium]|nr:hypothetical protein [Bacillota bacterium]